MCDDPQTINKVWNESCVETMESIPNDWIDLVITSPPYDHIRDYEGFWNFGFEDISRLLYLVMKPGGMVVWLVGDQRRMFDKSGNAFKQALHFKELGFKLFDTMIYLKYPGSGYMPYGYYNCYDFMFCFSKGKPKTMHFIKDRMNKTIVDDFSLKKKTKYRTLRNADGSLRRQDMPAGAMGEFGKRGNVWLYSTGYMKMTSDKEAYQHPSIYPERLVRDHITSWSEEGDLVYDPFMGSGTTCKIAKAMGRNYIGSEINENYFAIAKRRIAEVQAELV